MDFQEQSALYAAILALAVAVAVLLRSRRSRLQVLFATLAINLATWRGFAFLASLTEHEYWRRAEFLAGCLIPLTALRFFVSFPDEPERRARRFVFPVATLSLAFAGIAALTDLYRNHAFGAVVLIYVFIVLFLCSAIVYRYYRRMRNEQEALRLKYLFSGGFITTTLAGLDYLPALGVDFPALGNVALLIYLYLLYQTVSRHRLLDLNELLGRALVLGLLAAILAGTYSLLVLWTTQWSVAILNALIASLLIVIVIDPLRTKVEEAASRFLFREKFELERRLNALGREMTNVIEVEDLWKLILRTIEESRRATHASIYLTAEDGLNYLLQGAIGPAPPERVELQQSPALIRRLRYYGEPVIRENVERELEDWEVGARRGDPDEPSRLQQVIATFDDLNAGVVIPFRTEDRLLGFLCLKDERLREAYSPAEIDLLRGVASQAVITIENSKLYERLKERDRLAALGEMAAGLAHEIRNPLGAIKGAAQYLSVEPEQPDAEFLAIIVEEVNRLNHVVTQFLDYARPHKPTTEAVDLNEVLRKTLQLVGTNGSAPAVDVVTELDNEVPRVAGDPQLLKQVFLNLAINAVEAMPEGGSLTVRSHFADAHLRNGGTSGSPPAAAPGEKWVDVEFTDTGTGMSQRDLNNLFIPFYTTKERGTGLGLAICQRIVKGHGGAISVRSRKGRGTTFTVRLPVDLVHRA